MKRLSQVITFNARVLKTQRTNGDLPGLWSSLSSPLTTPWSVFLPSRPFSLIAGIMEEHDRQMKFQEKLIAANKMGVRHARLSGVKSNGKTPRFYKRVSVIEEAGEFALTLGGRLVLTPKGNLVAVPSAKLAWAIAFEWECQLMIADLTKSPLPFARQMHLVTVAIDQMVEDRDKTEGQLAEIIHTDQICHREVEQPGLLKLQHKFYDPVFEWLQQRHGVSVNTTDTHFGVPQPPETVAKIREIVTSLDKWQLAVVDMLASVTRSIVVSLAVVDGVVSAKQCYEMARLEENFQIRKHGFVEGAFGHGIEQEYVRLRASSCSSLLKLLYDKQTFECQQEQVDKATNGNLKKKSFTAVANAANAPLYIDNDI